jgi:hypothetical protein
MSTFGKQAISIRKKDVTPSRSPAVATRKIRFAHKATLGQTVIDMNALVTPSLEMPTFVNASAAEIAAARLTLNRKNLSLKSSLAGMLIQDLDFVPVTATTILLLGNYATVGAADGEIFEGVIDQVPVSDLIVSEGRNIKGTVEVAVGVTSVNLGSIFKVNENAAMQIGAVKIWRNGVLQARNTGNATASPSADGNYQEMDAGNGYGTTITLNVAPAVQSDLIQFEIGFQIYNGDIQIFSDLERQQGMIQKLAADAAVAFGNPITDYLTASPTEQERRAFGDLVLSILDVEVPVIAKAVTYTPADVSYAWGTVSASQFKMTRRGNMITVRAVLTLSSAVTGDLILSAAEYLPSGLTVEAAELVAENLVGNWYAFDASAPSTSNEVTGSVYSTTGGQLWFGGPIGTDFARAAAPFTWASGDKLAFAVELPITEWATIETIRQKLGL